MYSLSCFYEIRIFIFSDLYMKVRCMICTLPASHFDVAIAR